MPPFFGEHTNLEVKTPSSPLFRHPLRYAVAIRLWIDRYPGFFLFTLFAYYWVLVLVQARVKLFWADELITLSIAMQPGMIGIWRALVAGADPNPPLLHLMVQASTHTFGVGPVAVRLPAMFCVFLTLGLLWAMLRRWVQPVFAAVGVLVFMATRGFDYAYDARSYAPLLLFTIAALAFWTWLPDTFARGRILLCAAFAAALGGAVSSNYYGVLATLPVAAGELARSYQGRKFRLEVWLAMVLGLLPLLWYVPLVRHNLGEFGPHAWNPPSVTVIASSYLELVEAIVWPVLLLLGYALRRHLLSFCVPRPEFIAVGTLLVYPLLGYGLAKASSAMISPRCVVPVCCGVGLAAGVVAQRVFGRVTGAGPIVILFLLVWITAREAVCTRLLLNQRHAFLVLRDDIRHQVNGRILVADSSFALPLSFYSDIAVRQRVLFPVDFPAIHQYEADDSGEENLWAGRQGVFPFPVLPLSAMRALQPEDLVIARPDGWLAHDLTAAGCKLTRVSSPADRMWGMLGGVFTPMGHRETRELRALSACGSGMMKP